MAKYKYETPFDRMHRERREDERRADIASETKKRVTQNKPGAPYYQPQNEAIDKAQIRADAQGAYMKSQVGDNYQRDEGFLADTGRAVRNLMAGKRGLEVAEHGDRKLMSGAREAGFDAVRRQSAAELKREARGKEEYKSGGKVSSASSRADGCATKGKTKGRFV